MITLFLSMKRDFIWAVLLALKTVEFFGEKLIFSLKHVYTYIFTYFLRWSIRNYSRRLVRILFSVNCYSWGHLKNDVHETTARYLDEFKEPITREINHIKKNSTQKCVSELDITSLRCRNVNGYRSQHLLKVFSLSII